MANREGQQFRIPRASVADMRLGGERTLLWSLATIDGALIGVPVGLIQWAGEAMTIEAMDGNPKRLPMVVDEDEVNVPAEVRP